MCYIEKKREDKEVQMLNPMIYRARKNLILYKGQNIMQHTWHVAQMCLSFAWSHQLQDAPQLLLIMILPIDHSNEAEKSLERKMQNEAANSSLKT